MHKLISVKREPLCECARVCVVRTSDTESRERHVSMDCTQDKQHDLCNVHCIREPIERLYEPSAIAGGVFIVLNEPLKCIVLCMHNLNPSYSIFSQGKCHYCVVFCSFYQTNKNYLHYFKRSKHPDRISRQAGANRLCVRQGQWRRVDHRGARKHPKLDCASGMGYPARSFLPPCFHG